MPPPRDPAARELWRQRNSEAQRVRATRVRSTPAWDAWRALLSARTRAHRLGRPPTPAQVEASKLSAARRRGQPLSEEHRRKVSVALMGRTRSPEHRAHLAAAQRGRPKTEETRARISATMQGRRGALHGLPARFAIALAQRLYWEGRRDPNKRNSHEYRRWRRLVLSRDGYACQRCRSRVVGKRLHAHHVKEWDDFPELRFDVANGLTLCGRCHLREHHAQWTAANAQDQCR